MLTLSFNFTAVKSAFKEYAVALFQQLILGSNRALPCTHPRMFLLAFLEKKFLPDPIPYPCFQKQLIKVRVNVSFQSPYTVPKCVSKLQSDWLV